MLIGGLLYFSGGSDFDKQFLYKILLNLIIKNK